MLSLTAPNIYLEQYEENSLSHAVPGPSDLQISKRYGIFDQLHDRSTLETKSFCGQAY